MRGRPARAFAPLAASWHRRALFGAAAALLAPAWLSPAPAATPQRIMTLDMCDDLMLLMLVAPRRIASITHLAHPAALALLPAGSDAGIAVNHGTAEDIVRARPDLIVGTPFSAATARRLAAGVGARLIELPIADSFDGIRANLRAMGAAVGEPARAEVLVRRMDEALSRLDARRPARRWRIVAWTGGDSVPGRGTLTDAIITAAGAENVAAHFEDGRSSSFDLEQLLAARPDAVVQSSGTYEPPSLRRANAGHPLLGRAFADRRITYPAWSSQCGLPQSALVAAALRRVLERLPASGPRR